VARLLAAFRAPVAAVLAAVLLLGPVAPGLSAFSDKPVQMCSMHGRNCTCPDMCKRGGEHSHGEQPEPDEAGPACHRKSGPAKKTACQMNSCGREEPVIAFSAEPATPALEAADSLQPPPGPPGSAAPGDPHALDLARVPPAPPPRLFS